MAEDARGTGSGNTTDRLVGMVRVSHTDGCRKQTRWQLLVSGLRDGGGSLQQGCWGGIPEARCCYRPQTRTSWAHLPGRWASWFAHTHLLDSRKPAAVVGISGGRVGIRTGKWRRTGTRRAGCTCFHIARRDVADACDVPLAGLWALAVGPEALPSEGQLGVWQRMAKTQAQYGLR